MQSRPLSVKRALILTMSVLMFSMSADAKLREKTTFHVPDTLEENFEPHTNYLVQLLKYPKFLEIREKLDKHLSKELLNRGEAHITVLTPPEFEILSEKLTIEDINQVATSLQIQKASYRPLCIGKGTLGTDSTYFIVIKSPGLVHIRQKISDLYHAKGGSKSFDPAHFYPHVTLGFTTRDLHEQDGVVKNESSCWKSWTRL